MPFLTVPPNPRAKNVEQNGRGENLLGSRDGTFATRDSFGQMLHDIPQ
jgi:hypothetical protein